jgi:hypothetical protein
MSERELAAYPRDKIATMTSDWRWILRVLRQIQDQALDGVPLHLEHPKWFPPEADVIAIHKRYVTDMIEDILSSAIVVHEPEPPNADASQ